MPTTARKSVAAKTPAKKAAAKKPAKTPVTAAPKAIAKARAPASPRPAAPAAAPAQPPKAPKPAKREKLVRDSFTIPKGEYAVLAALKKRAEALARPAKKSELLRAGVKLLAGLDDAAFLAALAAVPAIKTGRPAGG